MPTFLHVTQGPDVGRKFSIERDTVRIGSDSNANIRLNDPQLQGLLLIKWRNGVYHVTNQLSSPIWYRTDGNREEFSQGEERVWYDGARLQPSAKTELLLRAELDTATEVFSGGIRETTEGKPASHGVPKTLGILGIALGILILMASVDSNSQPSQKSQNSMARAILQNLDGAGTSSSAQFDQDWGRLSTAFREARLADRSGDRADAANLYLKCSRILNVLRKQIQHEGKISLTKAHTDALEKISILVKQRKLKLSR